MVFTLTRDQVRQVDKRAIEELGIPGLILMENAGRNTVDVVLDMLELELQLVAADAQIFIFCGGGNNGGDGYVIARHLANMGAQVTAFAVVDPDKLQGDAKVNHTIAAALGLVEPLHTREHVDVLESESRQPHIVVDAMLGTGFTGEVREPMASAIHLCNSYREKEARIISVDVPSGLDCDTGQPSNATIQADVTVSLVAVKRGYLQQEAQAFVGRVVVAEIGAPSWLALEATEQ